MPGFTGSPGALVVSEFSQGIVSGRGEPGSDYGIAHLGRRHGVEVHLVIVHAEGGNRRAIAPLQVVPAPAGAVAFKEKPGVVTYDISGHRMDTMADDLVGHILQRS